MSSPSGPARSEGVSPVQSLPYTGESQPPRKPHNPDTGDSISSSTTSKDGCLAKFWKAICNFFKCIFPCLFGRKAEETSSQNTKRSTNTNSNNMQSAPKQVSKPTPPIEPLDPQPPSKPISEPPLLSPMKSPAASKEVSEPPPELSSLEKAQVQLFMWWNEKLENGQYKNREKDLDPVLVKNLQAAAEESACPKEQVNVFYQHYTNGPGHFYATSLTRDAFFPIHPDLGLLLKKAKDKSIPFPWSIPHLKTKERVIVQVELWDRFYEDEAPGKTWHELFDQASRSNKCVHFRFLEEAFIPYANSIKEALGNKKYAQLGELIPAYKDPARFLKAVYLKRALDV